MDQPFKLSKELEGISKMHYEVLLFGYKIAEGLRNDIAVTRLKAYADWFLEKYIKPHFQMEETYIFPVLGLQNVRVKRALANHRRLLRLFEDTENIYLSINRIEEEIGSLVRFEDKVLLQQIQEKITKEELKKIKEEHEKIRFQGEEWTDKFWEE